MSQRASRHRDPAVARVTAAAALLVLSSAAHAAAPLVAGYALDDETGTKARDAGAYSYHANVRGAKLTPNGKRGGALYFDSKGDVLEINGDRIHKLGVEFSITFWVKIDRFPNTDDGTKCYLIWKGGNNGYQLGFTRSRKVFLHGKWGGGWYHGPASGKVVPRGKWAHIAWTMKRGGTVRVYVDGKSVLSKSYMYPFWPVGDPLRFGGLDFTGMIDEVRIYASELSADEIRADAEGKLPVRAPRADEFPEIGYSTQLLLVRFDMPKGDAHGTAPQKQLAERVDGPHAVDWPRAWVRVDGRKRDRQEIWTRGAKHLVEAAFRKGGEARPWRRRPYDSTVEPYDHWFRAMDWRWGRQHIYTGDRTVRSNAAYVEIWTFPVKIAGDGAGGVKSVKLTLSGEVIYERNEALDSLTLLLPANRNGSPYELTVNGAQPVRFDVDLEPVEYGRPVDRVKRIDLAVPGTNVRVASLDRPRAFPHQKLWGEDVAAMAAGKGLYDVPAVPERTFAGRIGLDVPRSPVTTFGATMRHGMSAGWSFGAHGHIANFKGTYDEYAAHLARLNFDVVLQGGDRRGVFDAADKNSEDWYARWLDALAKKGICGGFHPSGEPNHGVGVECSNLAFYSVSLPEFGPTLYRDIQLMCQRYLDRPNFAGMMIGGDNGAYVPFWHWAPPHFNRPWIRAFDSWRDRREFGDRAWPEPRQYKRRTNEFLEHIRDYDETFENLGYFRRAAAAVDRDLVFTTNFFGSAPGVIAGGGYPIGSVPCKPIYEGYDVMTVYDWNEKHSHKPLHNVQMIDRLRSTYPDKQVWSCMDDFALFFGRGPRERAVAIALSRGLTGIGCAMLPHTTAPAKRGHLKGDRRAEIMDEYRDLYDWAHRYGGAYAQMRSTATIGVLYVHLQSTLRNCKNEDPRGPHEGKTTEALVMCHAAGWPARIVTPDELGRGLPDEMKALLLVGLNRFDDTWVWCRGFEDELRRFVDGGGRVIVDDESVAPVTATKTGMTVVSYVKQSDIDQTPKIVERNRDNIAKLKAAMSPIASPICRADDQWIWIAPSVAGNTQYVTVTNQTPEKKRPGRNDLLPSGDSPYRHASVYFQGRTVALTWNTDRPIYDVRAGRKISPAEAARCDMTRHAFRLYALPPAEVGAPKVSVKPGEDGSFRATVTTGDATGVPVRYDISHEGGTATVWGASGLDTVLPIEAGTYEIRATELLSGRASTLPVNAESQPFPAGRIVRRDQVLRTFAKRGDVPLVVALTPRQREDAGFSAAAKRLVDFYTRMGRTVRIGSVSTDDVVMHRQPYHTMQRYPQWYTVDADLVLFGSPQNNILVYDQARGHLLPQRVDGPEVRYTFSPFVGERDCVNVLGDEPAAAVDAIIALSAAPESQSPGETHVVVPTVESEDAPPAVEPSQREAAAGDAPAETTPEPTAPEVESADKTVTYAVVGGVLLAAAAVVASRLGGGRKSVKRRRTPVP